MQSKGVQAEAPELDSTQENDDFDEEASSSDVIDSNDSTQDSGSSSSEGSGGQSMRKRKRFVIPPPRSLPQRTTRGKRMGELSIPDDDDADEEFWNQEFFAEEERDDRYETESEPEDRFDDDFLDSEEEEDDAEEEEEARISAMEPRKKVLKPPGYKKKKTSIAEKKDKSVGAQKSPSTQLIPERTMSVRSSTRQKLEEAEELRKFQEEIKPKKVIKPVAQKQLTQAELLAEAARTEIENTRSLQYMEAIEEENKRQANNIGGKYNGPMISVKSARNADGFEQTTLVVKNMSMPVYLLPQHVPPVPPKDMCVVTNTIAKYKDPLTGKPYANMEAFKVLRGTQKQP